MEKFIVIFPILFLAFGIFSYFKSKGIMEKYNNKIGYISSFLVLCSFLGILIIIGELISPSEKMSTNIITGIIVIILGVVSFIVTYKKMPKDTKIPNLILAMIIVGLGAVTKWALWVANIFAKLIFHIDLQKNSGSKTTSREFASQYSDGEETWFLEGVYNDLGEYAYLKCYRDESKRVRVVKSMNFDVDGYVHDENNKVYYPVN